MVIHIPVGKICLPATHTWRPNVAQATLSTIAGPFKGDSTQTRSDGKPMEGMFLDQTGAFYKNCPFAACASSGLSWHAQLVHLFGTEEQQLGEVSWPAFRFDH